MSDAENPFYKYYDLLATCKEFDVTLSLGNALDQVALMIQVMVLKLLNL